MKDINGQSLNVTLYISLKLQCDISCILFLFRPHRIVFSCDMQKMFRQILIDRPHMDFQGILCRFSKRNEVQEYILETFTYGP